MARVKRRPGIGRVTRYCVPVAAVAGPTVLLNADYLTDTILNDVSAPAGNLDALSSWATATGGTFTKALAVAAGASVVDGPFYVTTSGIHTDGVNVALTVATPITIPANTDCVIYVKVKLQMTSQLTVFGNSASDTRLELFGDWDTAASFAIANAGSDGVTAFWGTAVTTATLYRLRRSGSTWYAARTGDAEQTMTGFGTTTAAISINTLLAYSSTGSGLNQFSQGGNYLQKLYIRSGTSTPDTDYETANGGTL